MANEKRLIDANALIEDLKAAEANAGMGSIVASTLIRYVKRCDTVDAVEVVYCQECARCRKGFCAIRKDSWGATLEVGLHDFCSDGERSK